MAPERLLGATYDGRSDIYSVGVMAYQMLAGKLLFEARGHGYAPTALRSLVEAPSSLVDVVPGLTEEADALVRAAMARRPEDRPSAAELGASFARFAMADDPRAQR